MSISNIYKISLDTKKSLYRCCLYTTGINKYKSKFIFNLYNNCIYKKYKTINGALKECNNRIIRYLTVNTDILKKNSIKFNNKKLNIIKTNEN